MPKKLAELPRQTVWVDKRGRFTIPEYLRDAAGIKNESWIDVEAYESLENCKSLFIMKSY